MMALPRNKETLQSYLSIRERVAGVQRPRHRSLEIPLDIAGERFLHGLPNWRGCRAVDAALGHEVAVGLR